MNTSLIDYVFLMLLNKYDASSAGFSRSELMKHYYGLTPSFKKVTLQDSGDCFAISKEGVRQAHGAFIKMIQDDSLLKKELIQAVGDELEKDMNQGSFFLENNSTVFDKRKIYDLYCALTGEAIHPMLCKETGKIIFSNHGWFKTKTDYPSHSVKTNYPMIRSFMIKASNMMGAVNVKSKIRELAIHERDMDIIQSMLALTPNFTKINDAWIFFKNEENRLIYLLKKLSFVADRISIQDVKASESRNPRRKKGQGIDVTPANILLEVIKAYGYSVSGDIIDLSSKKDTEHASNTEVLIVSAIRDLSSRKEGVKREDIMNKLSWIRRETIGQCLSHSPIFKPVSRGRYTVAGEQ